MLGHAGGHHGSAAVGQPMTGAWQPDASQKVMNRPSETGYQIAAPYAPNGREIQQLNQFNPGPYTVGGAAAPPATAAHPKYISVNNPGSGQKIIASNAQANYGRPARGYATAPYPYDRRNTALIYRDSLRAKSWAQGNGDSDGTKPEGGTVSPQQAGPGNSLSGQTVSLEPEAPATPALQAADTGSGTVAPTPAVQEQGLSASPSPSGSASTTVPPSQVLELKEPPKTAKPSTVQQRADPSPNPGDSTGTPTTAHELTDTGPLLTNAMNGNDATPSDVMLGKHPGETGKEWNSSYVTQKPVEFGGTATEFPTTGSRTVETPEMNITTTEKLNDADSYRLYCPQDQNCTVLPLVRTRRRSTLLDPLEPPEELTENVEPEDLNATLVNMPMLLFGDPTDTELSKRALKSPGPKSGLDKRSTIINQVNQYVGTGANPNEAVEADGYRVVKRPQGPLIVLNDYRGPEIRVVGDDTGIGGGMTGGPADRSANTAANHQEIHSEARMDTSADSPESENSPGPLVDKGAAVGSPMVYGNPAPYNSGNQAANLGSPMMYSNKPSSYRGAGNQALALPEPGENPGPPLFYSNEPALTQPANDPGPPLFYSNEPSEHRNADDHGIQEHAADQLGPERDQGSEGSAVLPLFYSNGPSAPDAYHDNRGIQEFHGTQGLETSPPGSATGPPLFYSNDPPMHQPEGVHGVQPRSASHPLPAIYSSTHESERSSPGSAVSPPRFYSNEPSMNPPAQGSATQEQATVPRGPGGDPGSQGSGNSATLPPLFYHNEPTMHQPANGQSAQDHAPENSGAGSATGPPLFYSNEPSMQQPTPNHETQDHATAQPELERNSGSQGSQNSTPGTAAGHPLFYSNDFSMHQPDSGHSVQEHAADPPLFYSNEPPMSPPAQGHVTEESAQPEHDVEAAIRVSEKSSAPGLASNMPVDQATTVRTPLLYSYEPSMHRALHVHETQEHAPVLSGRYANPVFQGSGNSARKQVAGPELQSMKTKNGPVVQNVSRRGRLE